MPAKKDPDKPKTEPKARSYVWEGDYDAVVPALSYELRDQERPGVVEPGQVVTTTLPLGPPFRVKE